MELSLPKKVHGIVSFPELESKIRKTARLRNQWAVLILYNSTKETMSYITEVTGVFLSCCTHLTILNPTDYTIIAEWEKQEIPLVVVIDSINKVCDTFDEEETLKIESIGHFQEAVKKSFEDWLQTQYRRV